MTNSRKNYILTTLFILFLLFLISPNFSLACSTECGEPKNCGDTWTEYKADTDKCGKDAGEDETVKIFQRTCSCVPIPDDGCVVECSPETQIDGEEGYCVSWQKAERTGTCNVAKWGLEQPVCVCEGECIKTPTDPRYYDNLQLHYPAASTADPANIFPPVKLGWKEIRDGGEGRPGYPVYVIRIENTYEDTYHATNMSFGMPYGAFPSPPPTPPPGYPLPPGYPPPSSGYPHEPTTGGYPPLPGDPPSPGYPPADPPGSLPFENGDFNWPTETHRINSCFGKRTYGGETYMHRAIDIGVGKGGWVYASAAGTVSKIVTGCFDRGWHSTIDPQCATDPDQYGCSTHCGGDYGNQVVINHSEIGLNFTTAYSHLLENSIIVTEGQEVVTGQPIGQVDNTGNSWGNHLDFEIRAGGTTRHDPLLYLPPPWTNAGWEDSKWCTVEYYHPGTTGSLPAKSLAALLKAKTGNTTGNHSAKSLAVLLGDATGDPEGVFTADFDDNSFTVENCLLKTEAATKNDRTPHHWEVKACCGNADRTASNKCGQPSSWNFNTNPAPELTGPFDADWNETNPIAGILAPKKVPLNYSDLKWCQMNYKGEGEKAPLSYKILIHQKRSGEVCHPLLKQGDECVPYLLVAKPGSPSLYLYPEFLNKEQAYFTKDTSYAWQIAACKDSNGLDCTDYSQKWRFDATGTLEAPFLEYPPNEPTGDIPVGLPIVFRWSGSFGSVSYHYEVSDQSGTKIHDGKNTLSNFTLDISPLQLNKKYHWKVQPCWDMEATKCENVWAESDFWTTGRPPKSESMKARKLTDIFIPVTFEWENVSGAKSFIFKVQGDGLDFTTTTKESSYVLDYPDLHQEKNYSWQVKTCARENGTVCGEWSEIKSFNTLKLSAPLNPSPSNGQEVFTYEGPKNFSWDSVSGARYYKYILNYVSKSPEETGDCPTGEIINKIIDRNSNIVILECLGGYQWQVQACLDKDCNESGDLSSVWSLTLSQKEGAGKGGLVPCGRTYDNPETPWNEREPCQIKHLFLIIKIILDFLLWNLIPIILVILAAATGAIFYLSSKSPNVLIQIKSIWKAVGIGILVIFLAWTIITIFMSILGYRFGIYGQWWQIQI